MLTIIDVSMWQGAVDWERVAASGIRLAFVKATQGRDYVDPQLERNRAGAEAAGIRLGFYHFADTASNTPVAQAAHLARVLGTLRRRELRPVLDLETGDPRSTEAFVRAFTRELVADLGCTPIFYTYSAYASAMRLKTPIGGGLWLASYARNDGTDHGAAVPAPWRSWVAHQYTSRGTVPGIGGPVDVSHAPKLRPLLAHPVTGLA